MLQMHMQNPHGPGQVWASPERDIAHAFPSYVYTALRCVKREIDAMPEERQEVMLENITRYVAGIREFMASAITEDDQAALIKKCGINDVQADAKALVDKWLARVVLGAYYSGVRQACHASQDEYTPSKFLDQISDELERDA